MLALRVKSGGKVKRRASRLVSMPPVRHIRVTASTEVAAPAQAVFEWVTDPARVPRWVKDLQESRPVAPGEPLREGSRSVEVLQVGRSRLEIPAEVTAFEPGRLVENRLDLPEGPCTSRVTVQVTRHGCTVTQAMTAAFTGMRWVPSPLLATMVRHRLRGDLARLKALAESE